MTIKTQKYYTVNKRIFDITFSIIGIILTLPLMIIIAVLIGKNPLYCGKRVGQFGKSFKILKFRTMIIGADRFENYCSPADDPRITKLGRTLRRFKLDELPQLFNVLMGKMSFVGCRPEVKKYVDLMTKEERRIILSIRPGMTDLATLENMSEGERLRGKKNPEKFYLEVIRPAKLDYQKRYVRKMSFWLDIKIIIYTIWRIIH